MVSDEKKVKRLMAQYATADNAIAARYESIDKIQDNPSNWAGRCGYQHHLKPGPANRIAQHHKAINTLISKLKAITAQLTYAEFSQFAEEFNIYDVNEDDASWKV